MNVGTRSVLFGYHCVLLHWAFVARGWYHLHGFRRVRIGTRYVLRSMPDQLVGNHIVRFPRAQFTSLWDPRLWLAFVIHDLGYWGKPNMDGDEGERHPEWAARVMRRLFGEPWDTFCLYHSRFYAKRDGVEPSVLCFADKLAIAYMPDWLYLPMINWSGEVHEYIRNAARDSNGHVSGADQRIWLRDVKEYVWKYVEEHKDGRADTWTTNARQSSKSGVLL